MPHRHDGLIGRIADFSKLLEALRFATTAEQARFLGFVLLPGGRRRLDDGNVDRFAGRLRGMRRRWRDGSLELDEVRQRVGSWIAHARRADTRRLRETLFRGGLFDPRRESDRPF